MSALETFRQEKDDFFKHDYQSPLTPPEQRDFTGLHYYPENPSLRLELALEKPTAAKSVILQTSTGDVREFMHAGQIRFSVGDVEAALQVYIDDYDGYFIPFVDATAPDETYGAGRYLEPRDVSGGAGTSLLVDFNFAYNPYCAYNERWSCPIPPRENRLSVRIEAGEKKFHD